MRTPLALSNLMHNKVRTLVATAGVTFAITLIFMQLGFFGSVLTSAILIYREMDYDLLLTSPHYVSLTEAGSFPRQRLYQAMSGPGVADGKPVYVNRIMWRNPETRERRTIILIGFHPRDPVFHHPEIRQQQAALTQADKVLVDRLSRPELGLLEEGVEPELGRRKMEIAGVFTLGPGFEGGLALVGEQGFSQLYPAQPRQQINLGLLKLQPGADKEEAAEQLRQTLPPDVRVLTRQQAEVREQRYWILSTSTGIIFGSGVLVAFAFGIVIIYQVLSTEISTRLSEYATLKAMGYSDGYLTYVILQQGAIFAILGYVPGFLLALFIYELTRAATNLPIGMDLGRAAFVLILTIVMCSLSIFFSLRIVRLADPADLF